MEYVRAVPKAVADLATAYAIVSTWHLIQALRNVHVEVSTEHTPVSSHTSEELRCEGGSASRTKIVGAIWKQFRANWHMLAYLMLRYKTVGNRRVSERPLLLSLRHM